MRRARARMRGSFGEALSFDVTAYSSLAFRKRSTGELYLAAIRLPSTRENYLGLCEDKKKKERKKERKRGEKEKHKHHLSVAYTSQRHAIRDFLFFTLFSHTYLRVRARTFERMCGGLLSSRSKSARIAFARKAKPNGAPRIGQLAPTLTRAPTMIARSFSPGIARARLIPPNGAV